VLAGANVHISFVGQDDGSETERSLNGNPVQKINANLTTGLDLTRAVRLPDNAGIAFQGPVKVGAFDVDSSTAQMLLRTPNPDGRSNEEVVRPWFNGADITGRRRGMWIVDFGDMSEGEAALYEAPFEHVRRHVLPSRLLQRRAKRAKRWWQHGETAPGIHTAMLMLERYIATPITAKHRLFVWVGRFVVPSESIVAIARDDDYTFGVLHSRVHELWALATGTQLETRPRYTPTTTFETFPFPCPTDEQREAIAAAAQRFGELRDGWLNPPGLDDQALAFRTLTNLYNERPAWVEHAHVAIDAAVLAAYGWSSDLDSEELLARLLELNLARAEGEATPD